MVSVLLLLRVTSCHRKMGGSAFCLSPLPPDRGRRGGPQRACAALRCPTLCGLDAGARMRMPCSPPTQTTPRPARCARSSEGEQQPRRMQTCLVTCNAGAELPPHACTLDATSTRRYCAVLCCAVLCRTVPCCTVLCCSARHSTCMRSPPPSSPFLPPPASLLAYSDAGLPSFLLQPQQTPAPSPNCDTILLSAPTEPELPSVSVLFRCGPSSGCIAPLPASLSSTATPGLRAHSASVPLLLRLRLRLRLLLLPSPGPLVSLAVSSRTTKPLLSFLASLLLSSSSLLSSSCSSLPLLPLSPRSPRPSVATTYFAATLHASASRPTIVSRPCNCVSAVHSFLRSSAAVAHPQDFLVLPLSCRPSTRSLIHRFALDN